MKILIGIPCMDTLPTPFVMSLMQMSQPKGTDVHFHPGSLVYDSRNLICINAIQNNYDYVMWLDSDMIVPADTIDRLLTDIKDLNASMVTGLYVKRTYPTEPVLYSKIEEPIKKPDGTLEKCIIPYDNYPNKQRFQVAGCGMGCVLTSVPLLRRVFDKFGYAFNPLPWAGEDMAFCYRVTHLDEPETIWCDSSISCGHVGSFIYSEKLLNRGDER